MQTTMTVTLVAMAAVTYLLLAAQLAGMTVGRAVRYGPKGLKAVTSGAPLLGLVAGAFLFALVAPTQDNWMQRLLWSAVPACACFGYSYFTISFAKSAPGVIRAQFAAAREISELGPRLFTLLDADGDGVISREDIVATRQQAVRAGVTACTIDVLQHNMDEFGHRVGSTGSADVFVISPNDIASSCGKLHRKYEAWLDTLGV